MLVNFILAHATHAALLSVLAELNHHCSSESVASAKRARGVPS
jgi:hypothetical protein